MSLPERITTTGVSPHIPFVASGPYPVRRGNLVRPLVGAAATFQRICDAIEAAQHSVWLTVAFISPDFQMPDRRGSVFDVLDDAVKRGLDVRVIFWRPNPQSAGFGSTFSGLPADRELLRKRNSHFRARWDRTHDAYCHHQKSWLIDAGEPSETAFIGGINLTSKDPPWHDIYVEVTGPSATDVHHSFVQRWNEASERTSEDGLWGHTGDDTLTFPTRLSRSRGESIVQIQRTVHAGCYSDGRPSPGGPSHEVVDGEQTIFEQYLQAIDAAQHSIYIENQAIPIPEIATRLEDALKRGVDVVVLVPADADGYVRSSRTKPERRLLFDKFEALGRHRNFALVGLARRNAQGGRSNIYVHGKIMLIDDSWATIGSCNLHASSMFGQTEMNASFWDPNVVRALRCELLAAHLGQDVAYLDDRTALWLYRHVAEANSQRRNAGEVDWQGAAYRLDLATYGL